jgi:phage tail-like protein
MFDYPYTGFHFLVVFELFPQLPNDFRFQEVSGLSVEMNFDTYNEGGENRFFHSLPTRAHYSDLILKRGMFLASGIIAWAQDAIENFNYQPSNLLISLLDENSAPVCSWYVVNAIPLKLELSGLNAEQNQIVIESLTLRYEYYKTLNLSAALSAAAGALSDLIGGSGTISISVP